MSNIKRAGDPITADPMWSTGEVCEAVPERQSWRANRLQPGL